MTARLRELNARAPIDTAVDGALDPMLLIEIGSAPAVRVMTMVGEAAHSDAITSFVLSESTPLAWPVFERAMETLIALRGRDLLRVKGFLHVTGCRGPVLVQVVQHLAHPPSRKPTPGRTRSARAGSCSSPAASPRRRCDNCSQPWRDWRASDLSCPAQVPGISTNG